MYKSGISVIVCTYIGDDAEHLLASLRSLEEQTEEPNEIIIVEDGPIPTRLETIISEFKSCTEIPIVRVKHQQNRGHGAARRTGVKNAKYNLVAIQDSDDISTSFRLEISANKLRSSNADVVGGYIQEFSGDGEDITSIRPVPCSHEDIARMAKIRSPVNHTTIIARREAIIRVGNYSQMGQMEDYELIARMINNGCKIINIPRILAQVRIGEDMFKRRGGVSYVSAEYSLQRRFVEIGFTTSMRALFNFIIRSIPRVLPSQIRRRIYMKFFRRTTSTSNQDVE